jgi:GNAT superfamily N-acetyltransferase
MGVDDMRALPRSDDGVLQAGDVGHRVVVRRLIGTGGQRTDLLGELVALDGQELTVRSDDGTTHVIPLVTVVAGKRIPPRPPRFSEMAALEHVTDAAWSAPEHERLGDWFLRAAEGFTNRANSALPVGDPGVGLDEAIDTCVRWYSDRSLVPRITVPLPLRRDVATVLTERGWFAQPPVLVQTAALADVLAAPGPTVPAEVSLWDRPTEGFLKIITARKAGLPEAARHILHHGEVRYAEIGSPEVGVPSAIARGARVADWMHLGLVEVVDPARRRGWARAVSQALAGWAADAGAVRAVLQVEQDNTAAVRLYGAMGFRTHHTYVTYRWSG